MSVAGLVSLTNNTLPSTTYTGRFNRNAWLISWGPLMHHHVATNCSFLSRCLFDSRIEWVRGSLERLGSIEEEVHIFYCLFALPSSALHSTEEKLAAIPSVVVQVCNVTVVSTQLFGMMHSLSVDMNSPFVPSSSEVKSTWLSKQNIQIYYRKGCVVFLQSDRSSVN